MTHQAFIFKRAASHIAAALIVVLAAGTFLYASHSTNGSYAGPAKPVSSENALHSVPAVTGIDTTSALVW